MRSRGQQLQVEYPTNYVFGLIKGTCWWIYLRTSKQPSNILKILVCRSKLDLKKKIWTQKILQTKLFDVKYLLVSSGFLNFFYMQNLYYRSIENLSVVEKDFRIFYIVKPFFFSLLYIELHFIICVKKLTVQTIRWEPILLNFF